MPTRRLVPPFTLSVPLLLLAAAANADRLTIERIFAAPDLSGASLRAAQLSPDGKLVGYLRGKDTDKDRLDLWAYDIAARRHRLLVDSARLAPRERPLSAEEEQRRERQRISSLGGIVEYRFSPDARYILVPLAGDLHLYDLRSRADGAVRQLTDTESYETDARFSPRGRYVSFVRDQNLMAIDVASGKEHAITREGGGLVSFGMAEFIAQEEMNRDTGYWWSPDDTRIAYARVDEAPVAEIERFEIYADAVKVVKQRYPAAGARNADVRLFVSAVPAGDAKPVRIDLGADADIYLARVDWFPGGEALAVQRQSRDQKTLSLLRGDPRTGETRELVTERSDTWVDLHDDLTFVPRSRQFIWASSRTGYNHLYLYDFDGRLLHPITSGDWMVVGEAGEGAVRGVDAQRGLVYFMANAETPLERHLYAVSFRSEGAQRRRLTREAGWRAVRMSGDARVFLDTFSTPDRPPSVTLRDAGGRTLATLVDNTIDEKHPYRSYLEAHVPTEYGTLAADGQTLHYQLLKPRNLEPGKRYPVIVDVYGGPGAQRVRRAWGGYPRSNEGFFRQFLAQNGYVVFTLDNRGSGFRGVAFESALHRKMGSVEVQDQVTGVEWLRTQPYVDGERIGVFGWSYGGYMALMCAMQAPQAFQVAVSGAPVSDWSLYDTHYTERYMGTPRENAQGYAAGNVLTHARGLNGPLLLVHGMADDNVLFTHSTVLYKKLQDLGKPFDVMTYPGSKHGLLRHASTGPHAYAMVKRFFDEHLR